MMCIFLCCPLDRRHVTLHSRDIDISCTFICARVSYETFHRSVWHLHFCRAAYLFSCFIVFTACKTNTKISVSVSIAMPFSCITERNEERKRHFGYAHSYSVSVYEDAKGLNLSFSFSSEWHQQRTSCQMNNFQHLYCRYVIVIFDLNEVVVCILCHKIAVFESISSSQTAHVPIKHHQPCTACVCVCVLRVKMCRCLLYC